MNPFRGNRSALSRPLTTSMLSHNNDKNEIVTLPTFSAELPSPLTP